MVPVSLALFFALHSMLLISASGQLVTHSESNKCLGLLSSRQFHKNGFHSLVQSSGNAHKYGRVFAKTSQGTQCGIPKTLRPTVLYLSFHQGTAMDLGYVFEQLDVPFRWIIPKHLPYLVTREIAQDDWDRFSQYQCGVFDYVIFGDTVARARALLEHNCTKSQIILQVTQRFDAGMEGKEKTEWVEILQRAAAEMPNVHMVVNNPFEQWYMEHVRHANFFQPTLIRPSGHWPDTPSETLSHGLLNAKPVTRRANAVVVQEYVPYLNDILLGNLTMMGVPFVKLPHGRYGGAKALAQYRCVIQLPYQVSVMSMYENLAAGVVLLVPSVNFYRAMAPNLLANGVGLHLVDLDILQKQPGGWEAMEWFNPYFKDILLHFESWEHLSSLLGHQSFAEHQKKVRTFMEKHSTKVLRQWDSLLRCDRL